MKSNLFHKFAGYLVIVSMLLSHVRYAHANPEGGVVAAGSANIASSGNTLNVYQQSSNAVIDWRSFNIAEGEQTQFHQPGAQSMTLNRVNDMNPSSIQGRLSANGNIIIVNPNGVMFGANSQVDVNGIVATSADIANERFMAGDLRFDRAGNADAIIKNEGRITAAEAGLVGFVAPHVENSGLIEARLGRVQLSSGDTMTLDMYGDGLMEVAVAGDIGKQIVKNTGRIHADGGRIALTAAAGRSVVDSLIETSGALRARSVSQRNGEIIISAAGSNAVAGNKTQDKGQKQGYSEVRVSGDIDATGLNAGEKGGKISALGDIVLLEGQAKLDASGHAGGGDVRIGGDYQGLGETPTALLTWIGKDAQIKVDATHNGQGGRAIVWSDHTSKFYGDISARGGQYGGDGGFVEVSGKEYLLYKGRVDTLADMGETGLLFLDPANIIITNGSGDSAADGTATFAGSPSGVAGTILSGDAGPTTIYESELEGIAAATNISLAATNNITINDLADNNLNLLQNAGRSVTFTASSFNMNSGDTITTAGGAVNFVIGGAAAIGAINAGAGLVTLNVGSASTVDGVIAGTGGITKTGAGTLTLNAANTNTGLTTVTAGTLAAGINNALSTGGLTVNGGTYSIGTFNDSVGTVTLTSGSITGTSGVLTSTAAYAMQAGTASAILAGSSGMNKTTAGSVTLSGANTFTGALTLSAGTLRAEGNAGALGAGTLALSGGSLVLAGDSAINFGRNTTVNVGSTITSDRLTAGVGVTHSLGDLTFANNWTLVTAKGSNVSSGTAGVGFGSYTTGAGSSVTYSVVTGTSLSLGALNDNSVSSFFTKSGAGDLNLTAAATSWSVAGNRATINEGNIVFGASNALGAGTTADIEVNNTVGTTSTFNLNGFNQGIRNLTLNNGTAAANSVNNVATGAGTLTLGGNVTYTATNNPAGSTISGNLALGSATRTFTVNDSTNATDDLTVTAVISGSAVGVTKAGTGRLVLSGNNTYTGTTTVSAGNLKATGNANALGAGALSVGAGTLELINDTALNFGRNTTLTTNANIVVGRATAGAGVAHTLGTLTTGANSLALTTSNVTSGTGELVFGATSVSGNATFNTAASSRITLGAVSNGGTSRIMTKTGLGDLLFNAAAGTWSTVNNGLVINNGKALIGAAGALGSSSNTNITVNNTAGGTSVFDLNGLSQQIGNLTFGGTGAAATSVNNITTGAGTLTLNGTLTYDNTNNPLGSTISGKLSMGGSTRTLTVNKSTNGAPDLLISAVISNGSLTKAGTGTLTLTGENTHTNTTLSAGVLRAESNATPFGTGTLALNGGILEIARDTAVTYTNAVTVGGASQITLNRLTAGAAVTHTFGTLSLGAFALATVKGSNVTSGTAGATFGATTITGNGTFNVGTSTQMTVGALSNSAANRTLTKNGVGDLILNAAAGTWATTGNILTINNGSVLLGASNALGSAANTAITVNNTAGGTSAFDLNGNNQTIRTLALGGASGTATSVNNVATGAGTLTLGGDVTFDATGNPLQSTISGNLALGSAARTFTVANSTNAATDLSISAVISGTGGLTKAGAGLLALSGANTYTGATTINAGTLSVSSLANGGSNSNIGASTNAAANLVLGGGTLLYTGATASTDRNYTLTAATTSTFDISGAANLTLNGASTNTTGALTKIGTGTLTLSGANLYTGLTTVTAGTLAYGANDALSTGSVTVNGGIFNIGSYNDTVGTVTLSSGTISGTTGTLTSTAAYALASGTVSAKLAGSSGMNKTTAGTVVLSGQNSYTGTTSLGAGTLDISNSSALGGSTLSLGGGTFLSSGSALTLSNAVTIAATNSIIGGSTELTFNGLVTNTGDYVLNVNNTAGVNFTGGIALSNSAATRTLEIGGTGNVSTGVVANGGTAASGNLTYSGSGTLTLNGQNTFGGAMTVNSGTVKASVNNALAGSLLMNAGTYNMNGFSDTVSSVVLDNGAVISGTGSVLTSNTYTFSDGAVYVSLAGAGGMTKNTAGTVTLYGTNTFTGAVTVNKGVLALSGGSALADTADVVFGTSDADLKLLSNETIGSLAGDGDVLLNSYTLTLAGTSNTSFDGSIQQAGSLVKSGTGTQTLNGTNTYTGSTTVTGGTLQLGGNPNILASTGSLIVNGGTFALGSSDQTFGDVTLISGNITGASGVLTSNSQYDMRAGSVTASLDGSSGLKKSTAGTLTLSGQNIYTGESDLSGGLVIIGNNDAFGGSDVLLNGAALSASTDSILSNYMTLKYNTTISGTKNIEFAGQVLNAGNHTLNLLNSGYTNFSGGIDLSDGLTARTLTVTGTGSAGFGVISNGAASSGSFVMNGSGVATFNGQNTYTGDTILNSGSIALGTSNALASGDLKIYGGSYNMNGYNDTIGVLTLDGGNLTGTGSTLTASNYLVNAGTVSANLAGTAGMTKAGAGTVTLSGTNTFTGPVQINLGTLTLSGGAALADTSAITLANANATLALSADETIASLAGGGASGGNVTLGANRLTTAGNASTSYAGVISGTGGLTKSGTGVLTLSGMNTFTGNMNVSNGTLRAGASNILADTANLIIGTGATVDLNGFNDSIGDLTLNGGDLTGTGSTLTASNYLVNAGNISANLAGAAGMTKAGAGTVILSGTNTFTGAVQINLGTLTLSGGAALADTAAVTLANANATLNLSSDETIASLAGGGGAGGNVTLGANRLTTAGNASTTYAGVMSGTGGLTKSGTGTLILSGANTFTGPVQIDLGTLTLSGGAALADTSAVTLANANATLNLSADETIASLAGGGGAGGNVTLGANRLTTAGNASTTYAGVMSGTGGLTKSGTGTLILSGANTFTGPVQIDLGTLTLSGGAALADTSAVTLANANATLNLSADETIASLAGGGGAGGNVTLGANRLTVGGSASTTYAGVMSGTGGLTKSGTGTLILSGANTFTGPVQIDLGTLTLAGGAALADVAAVTLANANATLNLSSDETIASLAGGGGAGGNVMLGANRLTVAGNASTTYAGVISGTGGLTKSGTGVLTLSGVNTFTGNMNVSNGTLRAGASNILADTANLIIGTGATVDLNGFNDSIGDLTLNGGDLTGTGSTLTASNYLVNAGNISANLAGAAGMTKAGAGTVTLSGTNTFTGPVQINLGTLTLSGGAALADTAAVTLANANATLNLSSDETIASLAGGGGAGGNVTLGANRLTTAGNASTSYAGVISGTGGLTKSGTGVLTLSGVNTFTGNMNVSNGTLRAGASNILADTANLIVGSGATYDLNGYNDTFASVASTGTFLFGTGSTLTTSGAQSYTVASGTNLTLNSGGNVTVSSASSDFSGDLAINAAGYDVSIKDANALALGAVAARNVFAQSVAGNITLNGNIVSSTTTEGGVTLASGGNFINNAGSTAIQTGTGGSWHVYSASPLTDVRGGLTPQFKQYNTVYGGTLLGTGNGFIYSVAPTVTVGLTGSYTRVYDGTTGVTLSAPNFTYAGNIDGDTVAIGSGYTAAFGDKNVGAAKTITVNGMSGLTASNGGVAIYGYQLASTTASGAIGEITQAALTVTAANQTKSFGETFTFNGTEFTTSGLFAGDAVATVSLTSAGAPSSAAPSNGTPYSIVASTAVGTGLLNYNISYLNGTMTVLAAPGSNLPGPVQNFFNSNGSNNGSNLGNPNAPGGGLSGNSITARGCGYMMFDAKACVQNSKDVEIDENNNRRGRNNTRRFTLSTPPA